jgi:hypothetical protein
VLRPLLLVAVVVVAVGGIVLALDRVIDPRNEFYSGAPLTAALKSGCLIGDDVVRGRSYAAFKQDLFRRRRPAAALLGSTRVLPFGPSGRETTFLNLGFPGFDATSLLRVLSGLSTRKRLTLYVATELSWFDPAADAPAPERSFTSRARYLLSPSTLKSSFDLLRRSTTLAFDGWQSDVWRGRCVVDRGRPSPNWTLDGTRTDLAPFPRRQTGFAWQQLTALDDALALARRRGWPVVGFSPPEATRASQALWRTYRRELPALFAKHGFRWLDRSDARAVSWPRLRVKLDEAAHS